MCDLPSASQHCAAIFRVPLLNLSSDVKGSVTHVVAAKLLLPPSSTRIPNGSLVVGGLVGEAGVGVEGGGGVEGGEGNGCGTGADGTSCGCAGGALGGEVATVFEVSQLSDDHTGYMS